MNLASTLIKLRRFLRDPDQDIWTDTDLLTYWNDAQVEVAQKSVILSRVEAHHYPPEYNFTYTHDWERQFIDGDSYNPFEISMTRAGLSATPAPQTALGGGSRSRSTTSRCRSATSRIGIDRIRRTWARCSRTWSRRS